MYSEENTNRVNELSAIISSADKEKVIRWWNEYVNDISAEEYVYDNTESEFDEQMEGYTPSEIFGRTSVGYRRSDSYFYFNDDGDVMSFSEVSDERSPIEARDLATWIVDGKNSEAEDDFRS